MKIEKESAYMLGGLTTVELTPEIVKGISGEWGVGYEEIANTRLGTAFGDVVELAQETAPAVATLGLVYLGLKTMFKGLEGEK